MFLLPFSVVCRPPSPPSRTAWQFCFAGILGPHMLPHVIKLPFSVVRRPPYPPSQTASLFCWDPWTSRVAHVFLLPFSAVFRPPSLPSRTAWKFCRDPWTSCVAPHVLGYLSPWSVVLLLSILELPGNFARIFGPHVLSHAFLLPFSVVCCSPFLPSQTAWLFYPDPWTLRVASRVLGYLFPWSVVLLLPLLELPGNFAGILGTHVFPHVFVHMFRLPFSVDCRPPYLPSRNAWQFCRDPWTSRVDPRVSLTFLRGLSSSLSPSLNCLAILPGSLDLTCCPTWFSYLSLWSVVLFVRLLELPGNFAGILGPHVYPQMFRLPFSVVCHPSSPSSRTAWLFWRYPQNSCVSPRV